MSVQFKITSILFTKEVSVEEQKSWLLENNFKLTYYQQEGVINVEGFYEYKQLCPQKHVEIFVNIGKNVFAKCIKPSLRKKIPRPSRQGVDFRKKKQYQEQSETETEQTETVSIQMIPKTVQKGQLGEDGLW